MAFDLLAEVRRLEKHLKEVLAGMAVASKGKPMPPQASRLCGISQTLAEVRTGIEQSTDAASSSSSPKSGKDEGEWGKAFKAPPPPAASDLDGGPEDIAEAWVYDEGPSCHPSCPPGKPPAADTVEPEPKPRKSTMRSPNPPSKVDNEEGWEDLDSLDG